MPLSSPNLTAAIATTRFGLGPRPGELAALSGDARDWLTAQIRPEAVGMPVNAAGLALPDSRTRFKDVQTLRMAQKAAGDDLEKRRAAGQAFRETVAAEMAGRAVVAATTDAPFAERWALFWSNHFTVSVRKGQELEALAPSFEREAIRPHVFGRFGDLLVASSRHPAMLFYLDQAQSIGPNSRAGQRRSGGLNENLAREILELHTLGADGGYTQADVTEFARALTGWSVGRDNQHEEIAGAFLYRPNVHEPGSRHVLGRDYVRGDEEQALNILSDIAVHPQTALHIGRKLATHFVSDKPDPALVKRLADSFRRSGGDLTDLAHTLVTAPEAWAPDAAKVKTPYELVVSAYRAVGQSPKDYGREVQYPLNLLGQRPLAPPAPNGWSEQALVWAAPDAMIKRLQWAQSFSNTFAAQDDPASVATSALGARLRPTTLASIQRAESRREALTLMIMSPEFQRR